jgi:hypothetical protein
MYNLDYLLHYNVHRTRADCTETRAKTIANRNRREDALIEKIQRLRFQHANGENNPTADGEDDELNDADSSDTDNEDEENENDDDDDEKEDSDFEDEDEDN